MVFSLSASSFELLMRSTTRSWMALNDIVLRGGRGGGVSLGYMGGGGRAVRARSPPHRTDHFSTFQTTQPLQHRARLAAP